MHTLGIRIEYMHVREGAVKVKGLRYIFEKLNDLYFHMNLKFIF